MLIFKYLLRSLTERDAHIKGGERFGRENLREVEDFHFKGGRRFSLIREERGAGLFEIIIREAGK